MMEIITSDSTSVKPSPSTCCNVDSICSDACSLREIHSIYRTSRVEELCDTPRRLRQCYLNG